MAKNNINYLQNATTRVDANGNSTGTAGATTNTTTGQTANEVKPVSAQSGTTNTNQNATQTDGSSSTGFTFHNANTGLNTRTGTPYNGLNGLSDATGTNLGNLQQGYQQSDAVNQAYAYLNNVQNNKPGEYTSRYSQQLEDIYSQIMGRGDFTYDVNSDMLYQQMRDQYMQNGRQAMMDTMGQAAALTGGYGSSYGTSAGSQAYQQYLTNLNSGLMDTYDRAYQRYQGQGEDMLNKLNVTMGLDNTDYGRYQDQLNQWNQDRDFGLNQYNTLYGNDYNNYATMLQYWQNAAQAENTDYTNQQSYAYKTATTLLANGQMPTQDLLDAAGISRADAELMKAGPVVQYVNAPSRGSNNISALTGAIAADAFITNPADANMYANLNGSTDDSFLSRLRKNRNSEQ